MLDMTDIADRRTAGYSHGERTKTALARAIVHNPGNVLLDEPTNGLDVMSTRAVRDIIRRLKAEGHTVLFSSHVMQEVSALCDTIVVIARGRIVASGTPDDLRALTGHQNLEDAFVALTGLETGACVNRRTINQALVVFRKELTDWSRDRRSIMSAVIGTLFGPLFIAFMFNTMASRQRQVEDVKIPIVGIEYAPALVDWLRQQPGVEVIAGPADPAEAVRTRAEDVVVVIPKDFVKKFTASKPAVVRLVADTSSQTTRPKLQRVRGIFQRYNGEIGSLRLMARGISPVVANPLGIEEVEVSSAQQRAAQILSFIPLFIMMAAFIGAMPIATDSTAGERERGSLEALLVNPAPRAAIADRQMAGGRPPRRWAASSCRAAC